MRKIMHCLFGAAICLLQFACTSSRVITNTANVEQEIRTLEQQLSQVYQRNDLSTADRLLAPDYMHTFGVPARMATRADVMENYRNPAIRGLSIDSLSYDVERVQSYGNTAVAKGTFKRKSKDLNGRNTDLEGLFTHVWVNNGERWQLVASHNSPKRNADANKMAEQEIASYFQQMTETQLAGDTKRAIVLIDSLYSDDFISLSSTGVLATKDSIIAINARRLASVGNMQPFFETSRREDLKVNVYGDAAVATTKAVIRTVDQAKKGLNPIENRSMVFLVKQNGIWKFVASAVVPIRDSVKDKEQILALERKYINLQLERDTAARGAFYRQLIADDFHSVSLAGTIHDKTAIVNSFVNPQASQPKLEAIEVTEPVVKLLNDAAVYTVKSTRRTKLAGGKTETRELRVTRTYARRGGEWKLVSQHITEIPQTKPTK